jgi:hypothetical protein
MKKTDNHYLEEKILLRKEVLTLVEKPKILECFSGKGILYDNIDQKFEITRIEIEKNKSQKSHLCGDSYKFLLSIDLTKYNIIDLDAYGIPFKYIDFIVNSNFKGYVIVTAIQTVMGKLPNELLYKLGYTSAMIKKIPTLFSLDGIGKLQNYLYLVGVKSITGYFINRKNYFYFKI